MIRVRVRGWSAYLAVFAHAHTAGADPRPVGGNEMLLPDDTDPAVVAALAGRAGVTITGTPPAPAAAAEPVPAGDDQPATRLPAKATPSGKRTRKTGEE